jgi:hypothetical protein
MDRRWQQANPPPTKKKKKKKKGSRSLLSIGMYKPGYNKTNSVETSKA